MKYFAYGMNTNTNQMARRCPQAVSLGIATLPGYEFRFAVHADVLENSTFDTDGVLWEISNNCLYELDKLEGYGYYYDRKTVTVIHEGEPVEALVYYMLEGNTDLPPSEHYLEMLYDGYYEHGISVAQLHDAIEFALTLNYERVEDYEYEIF